MSAPDLGVPTTLLLIRHASTDDTGVAFRGGDSDGPGLNEVGLDEADRLARLVRGLSWPGAVTPQAVLTSPVRRARETAAALAARLECEPETAPGWTEVSFGDWDGLSVESVLHTWPRLYRLWRESPSLAPPNGESLDQLTARVTKARTDLVHRFPGQCVAVVSHAGPIRAALAAVLEAAPAALWRLRVDPASVSVLRIWSDGGLEVAAVNLTTAVR